MGKRNSIETRFAGSYQGSKEVPKIEPPHMNASIRRRRPSLLLLKKAESIRIWCTVELIPRDGSRSIVFVVCLTLRRRIPHSRCLVDACLDVKTADEAITSPSRMLSSADPPHPLITMHDDRAESLGDSEESSILASRLCQLKSHGHHILVHRGIMAERVWWRSYTPAKQRAWLGPTWPLMLGVGVCEEFSWLC